MKILLVEDDESLAKEISGHLHELGHRVIWCTGAYKALEEMEKIEFGAIITDVRMPNGNGIELVQAGWRTYETLPPVCMHSSDDKFNFFGDIWNLPEDVPHCFDNAVFHNKKKEDWKTYIPALLETVK